jgi:outer membrane receptor for ferrienterochelin and colicin
MLPRRGRPWPWGSIALAAALLLPPDAAAEAEADRPIEDLTLEELMDLPVAVAAPSRPQAVRETPGIVTVITRQELQESGVRGLMEALSLVPGFAFGVDVQGVVGIGVRGIWGHEGKVLLLIDGQEMNELDYSTLQFGNHFPLDQVERIEVIRGPGSVVYGGFAELAVVNVITRSPDDFQGARASFAYGRMAGATARANASFLVSSPVDGVEGMDVSVGAYFGAGTRSDGAYSDDAGGSYDMEGASSLDPRFLNAALRYKGLQVRFLMDHYHMTTRDGFGPVLPGAVDQAFPAYLAEARYAWKVAEGVTLTPRFAFKHQEPWKVTDKTSELFCDRYNQRYTGGLTLSWDPLENLNVLAAVEGYGERHGMNDTELIGLHRLYGNGETSVSYGDVATMAQVVWLNDYVNVTAGARWEYHTAFGHSFVPRVALTKKADWFHAKALFAQAFRTPSVQNVAVAAENGMDMSPERTTVFELEVGAMLGDHVMLTASGFYTMLKDPIVFKSSVDSTGKTIESYMNFERTGSLGTEATLQVRHPRVWMNLAYSFYSPRWLNEVDLYAVPGRDDLLLAFPAHRLTLTGAVRVTDHFSIAPTMVFSTERFGMAGRDAAGNPLVRRFEPSVLLNLYLSYRDLGIKGLDIGFGVYNVLGADVPFVQPYDGGHAPLPGPSREYLGRISYTFTFE